jgi:hypothetical protein
MCAWQKHRRKGGETTDHSSFISFRRGGIAFNAVFASQAQMDKHTRVSIFVDQADFKIGLKFHGDSSDEDSYALCNDGGGVGRGRMVQTTNLVREHPWIGAIARIVDGRLRRFSPVWHSAERLWVVALRPSFENRVSHKSEIPAGTTGIYRYLRRKEIVYIGRGLVRSRVAVPDREGWDFDTMEYSSVADEHDQQKWETFWLDAFVSEHGKLPIYNRISGKRVDGIKKLLPDNALQPTAASPGTSIEP